MRLLVFTDRRQASRPLPDVVRAAVDGGAHTVVLREKDLPPHEHAVLARELAAILATVDGQLVVAGREGPAVHLAAADDPVQARLVGRSWHGYEPIDPDADYLTLSPVFATRSKPGYRPLGLQRFADLVATAPQRVYALGGVTVANAGACRAAGGFGIAVMGEIMRADDPTLVTKQLLAEVGE